MAEAISVSGAISGTDKTLSFETGKFALQSQGAVVAKIGKTTVLATANAAKSVRDGIDFMISGIPFEGPVGAVRLAFSQDGSWIAHPTFEEGEQSTFELVVAGRELDNGDVAVMMVEAGGTEKSFTFYADGAPKVTEEVIASGLEASKQFIKESIKLQRQLVASVIATRGPIEPLKYTPVLDYSEELFAAVEASATTKLQPAIRIALKSDRNAAIDDATAQTVAELAGTADAPGKFAGQEKQIKEAVRSLTKKLVRKRVVDEGIRIDGRGPADLQHGAMGER